MSTVNLNGKRVKVIRISPVSVRKKEKCVSCEVPFIVGDKCISKAGYKTRYYCIPCAVMLKIYVPDGTVVEESDGIKLSGVETEVKRLEQM